ncbi:hypothetical protein LIER_35369 [Lithospermum erythrorhizon]|uniref:Uncharacterized protein n=1 Tax=Lithospermum erythrorhizon TaxID=34254 RepID=A0AAV3NPL9_LITER
MPPKSKNTSKAYSSKPPKRTNKRSRKHSSSDEDNVNVDNVVDEPIVFRPATDNTPMAYGGKHVKLKIHAGGTCSDIDLQGTTVWECFANGEDARVEGEEVRTELPVVAYGSRDDVREDQDLRSEIRHQTMVQEQQGRDIKKNKHFLKGIMKFLGFFGKGEWSSSEA